MAPLTPYRAADPLLEDKLAMLRLERSLLHERLARAESHLRHALVRYERDTSAWGVWPELPWTPGWKRELPPEHVRERVMADQAFLHAFRLSFLVSVLLGTLFVAL